MRLYLSSFRMGNAFAELVAMAGHGARVAVIANATDFIPDEQRAAYAKNVYDPVAIFNDAGLDAFPLDLRRHFGNEASLARALDGVGLVWANGGNTFLLRRAMRQSGFDRVIYERANSIIYGGWSAGAVVACPHLRGIDLIDDPSVIAEGYDPEPVWEGLGLIEACIVPHFRSDHPESADAEKAAAYLTENGIPFLTLRDGDALIQIGDKTADRIIRS